MKDEAEAEGQARRAERARASRVARPQQQVQGQGPEQQDHGLGLHDPAEDRKRGIEEREHAGDDREPAPADP